MQQILGFIVFCSILFGFSIPSQAQQQMGSADLALIVKGYPDAKDDIELEVKVLDRIKLNFELTNLGPDDARDIEIEFSIGG